MIDDDFEFDIAEADPDGDQKASGRSLRAAKEELRKRAELANIKYEEVDNVGPGRIPSLWMPNGKEKRQLFISGTKINEILDVEFEKYTFLSDYVAVCSYEDKFIEASVRSLGAIGIYSVHRHLLNRLNTNQSDETAAELVCDSRDHPGLVLSLGIRDEVFPLLRQTVSRRNGLTLRIDGVGAATHDEATSVLEKVSNSLFFEIDLTVNVPLTLERTRRPAGMRRFRPRHSSPQIEFPRHEYDRAPMNLYWYARSAFGMPLLQYLAFYQVIEFYYPTYSKLGASRRLKTILKHPGFRPDRDSDIGQLLAAIASHGAGGFGDERGQLRATLDECVDPGALRDFLTADRERAKFYGSKHDGLTEKKIPLASPETDLRNSVADVLYDIRCRIVHTKSHFGGDELPMLLPFSREADLLDAYILLVRFVAEQVLITSSAPLHILHGRP